MLEDQKARERQFQEEDYRRQKSSLRDRFRKAVYSVTSAEYQAYATSVFPRCRNARVLEIGCGEGDDALKMAENGAEVSAIDISKAAIDKANQVSAHRGFKADFRVMDAEALDYADSEFDMVCGEGVLHHLNLDIMMRQLRRVLKPDGVAIFTEPLGMNPFLRTFRRLTPIMRSPDEHPLIRRDLDLLRQSFVRVEIQFFYVVTPLAALFYPLNWHKPVMRALDKLEQRFLFRRVPPLRMLAWSVCLNMINPKKLGL
jgi:SAM-dependent methyltransferase